MWAIDVYDKWRLVWFCYRHCISWVDRLSNRCSHFDYSTVNLNTNLQIYRVNLFTFKGCFRMRRMLHGCSTSVKQRIDNTYKQQLVNKRVSSLACCNVCRRNATNMVSYSVYRTRYFNTKNHVESFVPGVLLSCFFDTQESCFCLFLLHWKISINKIHGNGSATSS